MNFVKFAFLGAVALSLSSCDFSEKGFNEARIIGRNHPELHAAALQKCERKLYYLPIEAKRWIGGYIHVDLESMPTVACRRMQKGFLSGRMQWIDLKTLVERRVFTPRMTQILRNG